MDQKIDYIFSINTGRSGSNYLANILNHISDCGSFHEPKPIGNGQTMIRYSQGNLEPMRKLAEKKVEIIKQLKSEHQVYVETNHCFIKGFGWFIPQYLPEERIGVIILKREKSKIAKSLLRIGCSPLQRFGRDWISTPEMKDPLITPPKLLLSPQVTYQYARLMKLMLRGNKELVRKVFKQDFKYPQWLIDYELDCLQWYAEEIHEKTKAFQQKYPKIKYYETNIEELNSLESVQQMIAYFGLRPKSSLMDVVGTPTNLKLLQLKN